MAICRVASLLVVWMCLIVSNSAAQNPVSGTGPIMPAPAPAPVTDTGIGIGTLDPWQVELLVSHFLETLPDSNLTEEQCKLLAHTYFEQPVSFRQQLADELVACVKRAANPPNDQ